MQLVARLVSVTNRAGHLVSGSQSVIAISIKGCLTLDNFKKGYCNQPQLSIFFFFFFVVSIYKKISIPVV